ncbi:MAG: pantoate--beta-alanine ligase [Bacteroides sp. SM23_62]|nr:MAG: pantoate--beta-alanine ligase [Bacteroides sp. SM23_62]
MKVITKIAEMQKEADQLRIQEKKISLVPTMGYLHEGHLSLVREARARSDVVVMSIFVNPSQFGPSEDFKDYPRDFNHDVELARSAGCDIIFYPDAQEVYPEPYLTYVEVERLTKVLCGVSRPTHFRGVTTIVAKLFNIVKPQLAVFGQKDAQQAIVIKRMVKDLNYDIEIIVAPIIREKDGLAMSSRNTYLTKAQRIQATVLYQSLMVAKKMIDAGERKATIIKKRMRDLIEQQPDAIVDYIEIVDTTTLESQTALNGEVLIALAVKVGKPRLIDNIIVRVLERTINTESLK